MFITKRHLSRRTMLRGAGVAMALPLLDAMIPASTALAATAAARKPRLGFIYFPHGAIMEQWTPAAEGKGFPLSPILTPLMMVSCSWKSFSGVRMGDNGKPLPSAAGVHCSMMAPWGK